MQVQSRADTRQGVHLARVAEPFLGRAGHPRLNDVLANPRTVVRYDKSLALELKDFLCRIRLHNPPTVCRSAFYRPYPVVEFMASRSFRRNSSMQRGYRPQCGAPYSETSSVGHRRSCLPFATEC